MEENKSKRILLLAPIILLVVCVVLLVMSGNRFTVAVHVASKYGVGVGVALGIYLPGSVDEGVLMLCGGD